MKWIKSRKPTLAALAFGSLVSGNPALANNFTVDINDSDIAIDASNASLVELLREIEKLTGIPVEFVADTDERVTLTLGLTNIETAIGKITPNHMIVHENLNGKNVIKELIIIPAQSELAGTGSGGSFLPSGDPAPAVGQSPAQADPIQPIPADAQANGLANPQDGTQVEIQADDQLDTQGAIDNLPRPADN